MATALRQVEPIDQLPAVIPAFAADQGVVRFDEDAFNAWLRSKRDSAPTGLDMARAKDRALLSSYADQFRTERADFKRAKLSLTEGWREQTKLVNDAWSKSDAQIAATIDELLAPVTAWKEAEKAREAACRAVITRLKEAGRVSIDDTLATVCARGTEVYQTVIDADQYGSLFAEATDARQEAFDRLNDARKRLKAEEEARAAAEAERIAREAELEELRREKAERDRQAEEARIAEEARAAAAAATEAAERAAQAERDRVEAERVAAAERAEEARLAELERIRLAEEAAAEAAREQERAEARAEQERRDAAAQALIDEANERAARIAAEAAAAQAEREVAEAERVRLARIAEEKAAEAARVEAARIADHKLRVRVRTSIEQAFMAHGADDATAHKVAGAIIGGEIAHVEVKF